MSTLSNQARSRVPRIAEAAVERARLTVVPRITRSRAPRVPFVTLVSLLLVGGVAGLLFFNTSMQQASFTATALDQKATLLHAQQESLTMQLDALRDPQKIALTGRALGMVPPAAPAFLRLSDGKVVGKAIPATINDSMRVTPLPTRKPKDLRPAPIVITPATTKSTDPTATSEHPGSADGASSTTDGTTAGTKKHHDRQQRQGSQR
jgi:type II secretory pathway pseudopilin PulG